MRCTNIDGECVDFNFLSSITNPHINLPTVRICISMHSLEQSALFLPCAVCLRVHLMFALVDCMRFYNMNTVASHVLLC